MRPTRLDLDGFASFREPTTLDFTDADLFVLSGPTGAGKSSVIDAITFCLYGVVARYGDKRLVAPVISNGRNEARVQLHFAVGDQHYTAVRVVRRTDRGASTKEARLERWRGGDPTDATVLAATADEVSTAVESILGLGYEHFTTTVVLPQGAFQRFLHAKPSERQGLLVELLDLAVFGRIGQAARTRATTTEARATAVADDLAAVADRATDEAVATAAHRATDLSAALVTIDDARPDLEEVLATGRDQASRAASLAEQLAALDAVAAPDDLDTLTERLAAADEELVAARAVQGEARTTRRELDVAVDDLPSADAVRARRTDLARLVGLADEVGDAAAAVEEAGAAEEDRVAALGECEAAVASARTDLDRAREADLVATLTADVHAGDPCPVCRRPLDDDVDVADEVLEHATRALQQAEEALGAARRSATEAATTATRARERLAQVQAQHRRLRADADQVDLPHDDADLSALAGRIAEVAAHRVAAREAERVADQRVAAAERARADADRGLTTARTALDAARDRVAALEPPALDRDDLANAWATLLGWVSEEHPAATARLAEAERATAEARRRYGQRLARLRADLDDGPDVDTTGINEAGPLRDRYVLAHADARSRHQQLVELRDQHRAKQEQLVGLRRDAAVARSLGQHLNRNNFEKWLLARAVSRLVVGASEHLRDLTRGAYTLRLEPDGSFGIVDHANGGEVRSARTLSGGETFLASLSLALALSDHVADFAADGAARLESLFIDEGFGTLDAATVDVVRTALEELGSTGRMVGVVTHVQALAEQLPVQFHVRKESQSSVVERRDA